MLKLSSYDVTRAFSRLLLNAGFKSTELNLGFNAKRSISMMAPENAVS